MVIDTSALLAILFGEPEADHLVQAIALATPRNVGAPTLVEAAAVLLARKGPVARSPSTRCSSASRSTSCR